MNLSEQDAEPPIEPCERHAPGGQDATPMARLSVAWEAIAHACDLPSDFDGEPSETAYRAVKELQARLRDHILANNDTRLQSLLHLLGAASLHMEQALCPEGCAHLQCELEQGMQLVRTTESELNSTRTS
ncbi:hypothetical protein [Caballeronia glathei]|uniref:hypothetical protein n=1 Tax=Caballeronia glathei TaxID=60547 RepID=UPI0006919097|nr:hypothetical protein [Caballeronia glathei]